MTLGSYTCKKTLFKVALHQLRCGKASQHSATNAQKFSNWLTLSFLCGMDVLLSLIVSKSLEIASHFISLTEFWIIPKRSRLRNRVMLHIMFSIWPLVGVLRAWQLGNAMIGTEAWVSRLPVVLRLQGHELEVLAWAAWCNWATRRVSYFSLIERPHNSNFCVNQKLLTSYKYLKCIQSISFPIAPGEFYAFFIQMTSDNSRSSYLWFSSTRSIKSFFFLFIGDLTRFQRKTLRLWKLVMGSCAQESCCFSYEEC